MKAPRPSIHDRPTRPVSGVRNIDTAMTRPLTPIDDVREHRTQPLERHLVKRLKRSHHRSQVAQALLLCAAVTVVALVSAAAAFFAIQALMGRM